MPSPRAATIIAIVAVLVLIAVAVLDWYSHLMAGITSGGPVPLQSIRPRSTPVTRVSVSPAPAVAHALPQAKQSAVVITPQPSARPATPSTLPLGAKPKIINVSLSSSVVTGGQVVTGTVTTSPDVTSVQASIAGYSSPLAKVSAGYFALSARVPSLPFFLHRTYSIEVVASNARGESVSSSLPITVR